MSDRIDRMREAGAFWCPDWCEQPDGENGNHVGEWASYALDDGRVLWFRPVAEWIDQGAGGPGHVDLNLGGDTYQITPDDWSGIYDAYTTAEQQVSDWHVYGRQHGKEAFDGAYDEWAELEDAEEVSA